jgi:hypothetical protein
MFPPATIQKGTIHLLDLKENSSCRVFDAIETALSGIPAKWDVLGEPSGYCQNP